MLTIAAHELVIQQRQQWAVTVDFRLAFRAVEGIAFAAVTAICAFTCTHEDAVRPMIESDKLIVHYAATDMST